MLYVAWLAAPVLTALVAWLLRGLRPRRRGGAAPARSLLLCLVGSAIGYAVGALLG